MGIIMMMAGMTVKEEDRITSVLYLCEDHCCHGQEPLAPDAFIHTEALLPGVHSHGFEGVAGREAEGERGRW